MYHGRPFLKRYVWVEAVFFPYKKDSFHSGISLQKGASLVRYGFSFFLFTSEFSSKEWALNTKILANLVIFWRPENLKMSKSNINVNQKDWGGFFLDF